MRDPEPNRALMAGFGAVKLLDEDKEEESVALPPAASLMALVLTNALEVEVEVEVEVEALASVMDEEEEVEVEVAVKSPPGGGPLPNIDMVPARV